MDKSLPPTKLPSIGGAVTSPAAAAYAERAGVKKYTAPVGGAPPVRIPPLDSPHVAGQTMASQAPVQRPAAQPQGSIFSPPQAANPFAVPQQAPPRREAQTQILPTDTLPAEARNDPEYREGPGSGYAMTQQRLATKYGVMRNGQRIPPHAFAQNGSGLRPETAQQLHEVAQFNQQLQQGAAGAQTRAEEREIESQLANGPVGAARTASGSVGLQDPKVEKEIKSRLESMDKLDFHKIREMATLDLLNNEDQREIIEARCSPITLDEYVMNGFVRQRVPIVPGVFEVTFQSMALEDELQLKNLIAKEANSLELSDRYLVDKYGYMGMAVGLYMIHASGKDLLFPAHLNNEGVFDEALFWSKFKKVLRQPFHLAASLAINFFWFEIRVRRLPRAAKSA